jgi:hypothetical protein
MAIAKKKDEGVFVALRNMRDIGIDAWARSAVLITSTPAYGRFTRLSAAPGLLAAVILRRTATNGMSQLLGQLNLPSRDDVLALSTRLTHIEIVLDDLGAAVEGLKLKAAPVPVAPPVRPAAPPERPAGRTGRTTIRTAVGS